MNTYKATDAEQLQKRTNRFLRATEVGVVCYIIVVSVNLTLEPAEVPTLFRLIVGSVILLFFACLLVLFWYRKADEYTKSLWQIGTSAAFVFFILAFLSSITIAYPILRFGMGLDALEIEDAFDRLVINGTLGLFFLSIHVRRFLERGS